jgi:3D (Asp-Asp-Asp) domain-containing protein
LDEETFNRFLDWIEEFDELLKSVILKPDFIKEMEPIAIANPSDNTKIGSATTKSSTGITIYGASDWDWTTFLDLKPSERPPATLEYWKKRGYSVEKGEKQLKALGAKPGTLNLADTVTGAYGYRLVAGFSASSTKYPGGSKLKLTNPDGSIYDPAGINKTGVVTVHDTGNAELTYNKLDIFVGRDHVADYKQSDMENVKITVISLGSQINSRYKQAQKLFAPKK